MSDKPTAAEIGGALEVLRPPVEQAMMMPAESRIGALVETGIYDGIASAPFTEEQQKILLAPVDPAHVSWKASMKDGPADPSEWAQARGKKNSQGKWWRPPLAYVGQVQYRRRLNEAFGPGGWGLRLLSPPKIIDQTVVYHGALYVLGRFVAESFGEQDYYENNYNQSWATALESAKSDCLTRCCKDIGMFSELWEAKFLDGLLDVKQQDPEPPPPEKQVPNPKPPTPKAPEAARPKFKPEKGAVHKEQPPAPAPDAMVGKKGTFLPPMEWISFLNTLLENTSPEHRKTATEWLYDPEHRNPGAWWSMTKKLMDSLTKAGIDYPELPACVKTAGIEALDTEEMGHGQA